MKKDDLTGLVMVLIAIGLMAGFFIFAKNVPQLTYGPVEVAGSSLSVSSVPSDMEVDVETTVIKPGFITIHESIGGAPGPMVGTSSVIATGSNQSIKVSLSKPMTPLMPYIALMHVDNGDGEFVGLDDAPVMSDGKSVRADFTSPVEKK